MLHQMTVHLGAGPSERSRTIANKWEVDLRTLTNELTVLQSFPADFMSVSQVVENDFVSFLSVPILYLLLKASINRSSDW
jgi:hypothetical protein